MRHVTCYRFVPIFVVAVLIAAVGVSRADEPSTFRVVLLPDTQYYTVQPPENNRYSAQTQWIKDNAAADNTRFVIHLGDLVEGGITTPSEWEYIESEWQIADAAHDILEAGPNPVPYSVLPGNHDFNDNVNPPVYRDTYWYNQWFGPDRFAGKSWYGGYRDARGDRNDNNYCYFSGAGMDFMVLNMEFFPTAGMVAWADGVIKANPDRRVIVATHWYLNKSGSRHTSHSYGGLTDGRSGQDIWNELIKDNDNVFMVVCGHEPGEQWRQVTNSSGKPVFELLSDYQMVGGKPPGAGGDGWLTTLDFDAENDTIKVRSYSPTRDQYDLWSGTKTFAYDMVSTPPPPPPPAMLRAYWSFDQDGADLVGDSDMTLQAQATIASGNFGNGLHVTDNPAHGYASAAADPDLDVSSHFSTAMWVKYDNTNDVYARVIARKQDDDNGYNVAFWDGDDPSSRLAVRIMFEGDDYIVSTTDALVERDEFHHIAFAFNDDAGPLATNKIVLWIDGSIVATENISTTAGLQGVTDLVLGRGTADTADFAGVLDEVRFYSGVLSQFEITALQLAPLPGDANWDGVVDDADASILAAHWQQSGEDVGWDDGDFDGNNIVNDADASILAAHWQESIEDTSPVPEPGSLMLLGSFAAAIGALVSLFVWRRRGR